MPIMWDYNTPYFSWPFLASGGAYAFKKVEGGYDVRDTGSMSRAQSKVCRRS